MLICFSSSKSATEFNEIFELLESEHIHDNFSVALDNINIGPTKSSVLSTFIQPLHYYFIFKIYIKL